MPFLTSQGSFKPGRGFSAAGRIPNAPTFPNGISAGTVNDKAVGIGFTVPNWNGRTTNNNVQVCYFLFR